MALNSRFKDENVKHTLADFGDDATQLLGDVLQNLCGVTKQLCTPEYLADSVDELRTSCRSFSYEQTPSDVTKSVYCNALLNAMSDQYLADRQPESRAAIRREYYSAAKFRGLRTMSQRVTRS